MTKKSALFIDTSGFDNAVVAINHSGRITEVKFPIHQNWSEQLPRQIALLFKKAGIKMSEIEVIYVVRGPGSFSGTRTGVSFGNALALALNIPVFGVKNSFNYLTMRNFTVKIFRKYIKPVYSSPPHITRPKK